MIRANGGVTWQACREGKARRRRLLKFVMGWGPLADMLLGAVSVMLLGAERVFSPFCSSF